MAVQATAVWRVRPSGNDLNGGGYDPGIGGAGTDYSQQNAAQASGSNATCTTGTSTFVDATANAFTSAMIGNCIQIASGTNFTAGFYFVTAFTSASTVTLDRSPVGGSNGSVGVWKLGGGWATPNTNGTSSGPTVSGNTVFILGSGTPNPSSYTYDYTISSIFTSVAGVNFANDPATPGYKAPPDTTGGMPVIKSAVDQTWSITKCSVSGLWFVNSVTTAGNGVVVDFSGTAGTTVFGCVFDQFGFSGIVIDEVAFIVSTEIFSSVAGTGSSFSVYACNTVFCCNIHDVAGLGTNINSSCIFSNSIISNCYSDATSVGGRIVNCTIDHNGGDGLSFANTGQAVNCIISNQTGVGKYGINNGSSLVVFVDYNTFYNNTSNYHNVAAGPHDTALAVSPYVNASTQNYTLA